MEWSSGRALPTRSTEWMCGRSGQGSCRGVFITSYMSNALCTVVLQCGILTGLMLMFNVCTIIGLHLFLAPLHVLDRPC